MSYVTKTKTGYSLIISIVLIAGVALLLAIATSRGLQGRFADNILINDFDQTKALAESCAEHALLKRKINPDYLGDEIITIGNQTCTILPFVVGSPIQIKTEAVVDDATYRLLIEVTIGDDLFEIVSWQRVTDF